MCWTSWLASWQTRWPSPAPAQDLCKADLHSSLRNPLLDTMTFRNEITHRHPAAVSFAPGHPYDGFFDTPRTSSRARTALGVGWNRPSGGFFLAVTPDGDGENPLRFR
jgi:hypothetical protein